jgi:hypothetical protein
MPFRYARKGGTRPENRTLKQLLLRQSARRWRSLALNGARGGSRIHKQQALDLLGMPVPVTRALNGAPAGT